MIDRYEPTQIEPKWQRQWAEDRLYNAVIQESRPGFYFLTMLPYTSGDLHIGHWYAMAPSDVKARFLRMQGHNVTFPIGFDAFGLPAENAAIKHGIHPFKWTMANIERMRGQLRTMGATWDWDREAVTCVPEYYRWSQWFFLQFYKHGLAYRAQAPVDFCPTCNTTLAREQVWGEDRHCERCETPVVKKDLEQWFFRITNYADELLDFSQIDWPERVETMQRNWIGRSEGANVTFQIADLTPRPPASRLSGKGEVGSPPRAGEGPGEGSEGITVFTTRPDTLWGATFMVLAPEHPLVDTLTTPDWRREAVAAYRFQASRQSEIDRLAAGKEKTGVFIGAYAINPVNDERIPIWIADYVLMTYGTGAIMAVPAHDERDFDFAIKYGLPIIPVIARSDGVAKSVAMAGTMRDGLAEALTAAGISFEERDGSLYLTMSRDQMDAYIELAREHLKPGCWNEVVGSRWAFIFDNGVLPFDSVAADRAILARCQELEPNVRDKRTVMEMLNSQPFYRDVLFHVEYSTMIHSGPLTGTPGDRAVSRTIEWLAQRGAGEAAVNYRLRDWLISRQRYWGAPIPIVYCPECNECGMVPVPEADLPVLLPDAERAEFLPTGESPLKYHEGFRHTTCPQCGGPAERETDTMDTFMCSSWYQWRYLSPHYDQGPFDPREAAYWLPVDLYTGGIEHATMHLIYTRFFTKACRDLGLVDHNEPMLKLHNQGIILGEDNEKMSKSRGNVVDPDDLVQRYGADTVRTYLMFIGPWEDGGPWNSRGIEGVSRFYNRVWTLVLEPSVRSDDFSRPVTPATEVATTNEVAALRRMTHKTIRKVTDDLEGFRFNTMVAALMEFNNYLVKAKETPVAHTPAWDEAIEALLLLLAPGAPHITEELWARLGKPYSIHQQSWPQWDEALAADEVITLPVQVNGKVRARLEVPADVTEEQARALALADEGVQRHIAGQQVRKVIVVPGRLVNVVVG